MNGKHLLQLFALSALWGGTFPMLKVAGASMGSGVLASLRVSIAAVTLMLLMRLVRQPWPWQHWRELTLLSLLAVAFPFFLFAWSAQLLPAGYIALVNTTAVIFGTLTSAWLKEDTLSARKLLGCVCGFVGVGLILRLGPVAITFDVLLGTMGALLAALCFGVSAPLMKRATRRLEPLAIACPLHVGGMLFLFPAGLWNLPQAHFTTTGVAVVLMLGIVNSGLAFWAHLRILREVTPVVAMSPLFLMPMFGVTWGAVFLDEKLSAGTYLGGALVLLAAALVTGLVPRRWR